jgi:uncharacterized membrane protein
MGFILELIRALTELHPLHPMLVHFPIGLTGASCFFILLALWRRSTLLEQVAFANISLATLAVIAAGLTGMRDNIVNYEGEAPNANLKIVLASILLLVTVITSIARWKNPNIFETYPIRWLYVSAYGVSFALAIVLGFLGGVILYGF